jgi:hypothetical protein
VSPGVFSFLKKDFKGTRIHQNSKKKNER